MFEKEAKEYVDNNFYDLLEKVQEIAKVAFKDGAEFGYNKDNEELKEKISVLLSCKNCPENKGGWICAKEYENKCLAQKIEFIKELEKEKCELLGIIQGKDKEIIKRTVVENFCCNDCKEIGLFLECQKKKKSCETSFLNGLTKLWSSK